MPTGREDSTQPPDSPTSHAAPRGAAPPRNSNSPPPPDAAAPPDAGARHEIILDDHPCVSCGYNLKGLSPEGQCPECGVLASRSLQGDLLRFASPAYVRSVRRGAATLLWSVVAAAGMSVIAPVIGMIIGAMLTGGATTTRTSGAGGASYAVRLGPGTAPAIPLALFASWGACALAFVIGWWLLATPDPSRRGSGRDHLARRITRVMAPVCIVVFACSTLAGILVSRGAIAPGIAPGTMPGVGSGPAGLLAPLNTILGLALPLCFATLVIAGAEHARRLGFRVPDRRTAFRASTLTWLIGAVAGFWMGVALLASVMGLSRTGGAAGPGAPQALGVIALTGLSCTGLIVLVISLFMHVALMTRLTRLLTRDARTAQALTQADTPLAVPEGT